MTNFNKCSKEIFDFMHYAACVERRCGLAINSKKKIVIVIQKYKEELSEDNPRLGITIINTYVQ